eukprot:m51a1_g3174 putative tbc domain containing protein (202) ;mRNA; f:402153-402956
MFVNCFCMPSCSVHRRRRRHGEKTLPLIGPEPIAPSPSSILDDSQFDSVTKWLSWKVRCADPRVVFDADRDGFNLSSLLRRCEGRSCLLVIVESDSHNVFGAFVPVALSLCPRAYVGTGEAFLFAAKPRLTHWEWVPGNKQYFVHVTRYSLSIGHGGTGIGLWMDDELNHGTSARCETFNNEPLNGPDSDFSILRLEVIAF